MLQIISERMLKLRNLWLENDPRVVEFYEPLNDKTMKHKKMLLLASSSIIVAFSLGVEITSFSGIKFEHLPDTNALIGVLFWISVYELMTFLISFYSDLKAWDFNRSVFNADKLLLANNNLIDHVFTVSKMLDIYADDFDKLRALAHSEPSNVREYGDYLSIKRTLESISENLNYSQFHDGSLSDSIKDFIGQVNEFNTTKSYLRSKKVITYIFDFIIPLIIFISASMMSYKDGISVLGKVMSALF
jgi:hypothetical protein